MVINFGKFQFFKFSSKPLPVLYFAVLGFAAICFLHPPSFFNAISQGLDPSWHIAIQMAFENNLTFGKDIIWTYGPLGFLLTRLPIGLNAPVLFIFDLFFFSNLLFITFLILKDNKYQLETVIWGIILLINYGNVHFKHMVYIFQVITLFYYIWGFRRGNSYYFIPGIVLSLLLFFIKVNLGLISLVLTYGFLVVAFIQREKFRYDIIKTLFVVTTMLFLILAFFLNVNLPGYLWGSVELIEGYNTTMQIKIPQRFDHLFFSAVIVMAVFILTSLIILIPEFKTIPKKQKLINLVISKLDTFLMVLAILITSFILFKESFVRGDPGHVFIFSRIAALIFTLFFIIRPLADKRILRGLLLLTVALTVNIRDVMSSNLIPSKINNIERYYHTLICDEAGPEYRVKIKAAVLEKINT